MKFAYAINRLTDRVRMERGQSQMTSLSSLHRCLDAVSIPNFADKNDLRNSVPGRDEGGTVPDDVDGGVGSYESRNTWQV
jgi:hypothetical protein